MLLKRPSDAVKNCHYPKPILLDTGDMHKPWNWSPKILEIQLVQIGSVLICAVPFEITTMASRRLRKSLKLGLKFFKRLKLMKAKILTLVQENFFTVNQYKLLSTLVMSVKNEAPTGCG